jgi:hypothetical protein
VWVRVLSPRGGGLSSSLVRFVKGGLGWLDEREVKERSKKTENGGWDF